MAEVSEAVPTNTLPRTKIKSRARRIGRANQDALLTKPTINPYEPSQPAAFDVALVSLRFDGVIERADYQRMLPRGEREWWLCLVLAVPLGICIVVFGPVSVLFALSKGQPLVGLGLTAFWTLMLAGWWFLKRRISPSDRATRYLKLYPDVLGTAQGEFTAGGLSFHDGVHAYWFGSQHLVRTAISTDGMRVHVDASAHRYLALSARMFDAFNVDPANQLKRHWRTLAGTPAPAENPQGVELWNQISQPPTEAIPFRGSATTEIPLLAMPSETWHNLGWLRPLKWSVGTTTNILLDKTDRWDRLISNGRLTGQRQVRIQTRKLLRFFAI